MTLLCELSCAARASRMQVCPGHWLAHTSSSPSPAPLADCSVPYRVAFAMHGARLPVLAMRHLHVSSGAADPAGSAKATVSFSALRWPTLLQRLLHHRPLLYSPFPRLGPSRPSQLARCDVFRHRAVGGGPAQACQPALGSSRCAMPSAATLPDDVAARRLQSLWRRRLPSVARHALASSLRFWRRRLRFAHAGAAS